MKKLLGISLAMVMLLGSVPLGFSEPLKVQLENNTDAENLYCDNNSHVLVIRTNGNYACVSERTAERTGWEIISQNTISDEIKPLEISDETFIIDGTKNGNSIGGGTKYPIFNIEIPTQVQKDTQFNMTVSWSWLEYATKDGVSKVVSSASEDLKNQQAEELDVSDRTLSLHVRTGTHILDSGFILDHVLGDSPKLGYGNEVQYYKYPIKYDESQDYQKDISMQIDSIILSSNEIYFSIDGDNEIIGLFLFEDPVGVINIEPQQREGYNQRHDADGNEIDFVKKYEEDMKAYYEKRGLEIPSMSKSSPDVPERFEEPHNGKTLDDIPETIEFFKNNNITDVDKMFDYLMTENYSLDFIEEFLTQLENQANLKTQSFQHSFFSILPLAYGASDDITVYGKLFLNNQDSSLDSAKNVRVCAFEYEYNNIKKYQKFNDQDLCDYTGISGSYSITIPNKDMDDNNSKPDVMVIFTLDNDHFTIYDNDDYPVTLHSTIDNSNNVVAGSYGYKKLGNHIPTGNDHSGKNALERLSGAYLIYNTLNDNWNFYKNTFGYATSSVDVEWGDEEESVKTWFWELPNVIYFNHVSTNQHKDDAKYLDVISHEFAHKVQHSAYGLPISKDLPIGSGCDSHKISGTTNDECAWAEGWAIFASGMIYDDKIIEYSVYDKPINLETAKYDTTSTGTGGTSFPVSSSTSLGDVSEGWVASTLWDIYDNSGETSDDINALKSDLWTTFTDDKEEDEEYYPASTLLEFVDDWNHNDYQSLNNVLSLNNIIDDVSDDENILKQNWEVSLSPSDHYQTVSDTFTKSLNRNDVLDFDYMISSESNWDFGRIYINNVEKFKISGEQTGTFSYTIPTTRSYDLKIEYKKDGIISDGNDSFKIITLKLTPATTTGGGTGGGGTTDNTPPTLTVPSDKTFEATAINTPLTQSQIGTATATDDKDSNVTITNDAPSTFSLGDTTITYTATDDSDNSATKTQTITIQDNTDPVIDSSSDITTEATAINTPITITNPTASDIFDVTVTNNSTGLFSIGNTIIIFTATDISNNTSTDTITVTVQDNTDPVIVIPNDVTIEATAIKTPYTVSSANATDIFDVTVTNDAPSTFDLGTTTITHTATDSNGNPANGTQIITIQDKTKPSITAPDDVTFNLGEKVILGHPDTSDIFDVTITKNYTGSFPVGDTTLVWVATDTSGNHASDNQIITITEKPNISLNYKDGIYTIGYNLLADKPNTNLSCSSWALVNIEVFNEDNTGYTFDKRESYFNELDRCPSTYEFDATNISTNGIPDNFRMEFGTSSSGSKPYSVTDGTYFRIYHHVYDTPIYDLSDGNPWDSDNPYACDFTEYQSYLTKDGHWKKYKYCELVEDEFISLQ